MRARFNRWFHHYMGRDTLWNRVDYMLFGKIALFSFRREVNGLRWIFSVLKFPVLRSESRWIDRLLPFSSQVLNLLFWGTVLAGVICCLWDANFIFGDDCHVVKTICAGEFAPIVPISNGRFQLLCTTDANFILLLPKFLRANVPLVLYLLNSILLILASLCVTKVCRISSACEDGSNHDVAAFSFFLCFILGASVCYAFWYNPILESRIILGMSVFFLGVIRAIESNRWLPHIALLLGALLPMGYKENAFLLGPAFAGGLLAFQWGRLSVRNRVFLGLAAFSGLLFVLAYLVFVVPNATSSYSEGRMVGPCESAGLFFRNPLLLAALFLTPVRAVAVLFFKSRKHIVWDVALAVAVLHAASYVALHYEFDYYVTPDYVLAAPALCHWFCWALVRVRRVVVWVGLFALLSGSIVLGIVRARQVWSEVHFARQSDVRTLVGLSRDDPKIGRIVYYKSDSNLTSDYARQVFEWFLEYAAGKGRIEMVVAEVLPNEIRAGEALVLPNWDPRATEIARELREKFHQPSVRTSYYEIFKGPVAQSLACLKSREGRGRVFQDFNFNENALPVILRHKFYDKESWGRWTFGHVSLSFELPEGDAGGRYRFAVKVRTCTGPKEADVFCDNVKVAHWRVDSFEPSECFFEISGKRPGDVVTVQVEQNGLARPRDLIPGCNDIRMLGIGFISMRRVPIAKTF